MQIGSYQELAACAYRLLLKIPAFALHMLVCRDGLLME